jgi:hypothetical protein
VRAHLAAAMVTVCGEVRQMRAITSLCGSSTLMDLFGGVPPRLARDARGECEKVVPTAVLQWLAGASASAVRRDGVRPMIERKMVCAVPACVV